MLVSNMFSAYGFLIYKARIVGTLSADPYSFYTVIINSHCIENTAPLQIGPVIKTSGIALPFWTLQQPSYFYNIAEIKA